MIAATILGFHALLFCALLWIGVSASSRLAAQEAIFKELGLRGFLRYFVLLYPLAPLVLLFGTLSRAPGFGGLLAVSALAPGLILAHLTSKRLETSETNRTKAAADATAFATNGALAGLIYIIAIVGLQLAVAASP